MSPRTADPAADRVWKALASEVRREMLDALFEGPKTTGDLVLLFPELSRFAVMQHLKVLVRARLVIARKDGRLRRNFLNPVPIQMIYERWVSRYQALWAGMLTDIQRAAEAPRPAERRKPASDRRWSRPGAQQTSTGSST